MEDTESPVDSKRPYAPLGTRLFQRRVQIRMAASLLAERLDCSKSCVQHAEQGRRLPSDDLLARWAEALGIGADVQPLLALQREVARRATEAGLRRKANVVRARIPRPKAAG